jgi:hypothetical protein
MVTPAATIPHGRGINDLSVMPEQVSTPFVSCTPIRAGPSTLAELDAITVITSLSVTSIVKLITSCILPFLTPCVFLQADTVACTLLLSIHNVVADVAKGYIVQPLSRTFHYAPMPEHMFRIEVVRVILGYED